MRDDEQFPDFFNPRDESGKPIFPDDMKLMVHRLHPPVFKDLKISGYLETFNLPTTIPDIIEDIGRKYGGGEYQIKIVDSTGKYIKSKIFQISGDPKLPGEESEPTTLLQDLKTLGLIKETGKKLNAELSPSKPTAVKQESKPTIVPNIKEMKKLLTLKGLDLLEKPSHLRANELEVMKFLKELYGL